MYAFGVAGMVHKRRLDRREIATALAEIFLAQTASAQVRRKDHNYKARRGSRIRHISDGQIVSSRRTSNSLSSDSSNYRCAKIAKQSRKFMWKQSPKLECRHLWPLVCTKAIKFYAFLLRWNNRDNDDERTTLSAPSLLFLFQNAVTGPLIATISLICKFTQLFPLNFFLVFSLPFQFR